jgi:hypothetical protein
MSDVQPSACVFSLCGRYRYSLHRDVGGFFTQGQVTWIMLNPSTADMVTNDPTVDKISEYTDRWGFHHLVVVNAYAWVSTDPSALRKVADPVGPENDAAILEACKGATLIVCAWGKNLRRDREVAVARLLAGMQLHALHYNDDGSPSHPLYLPKSLRPVPFELRAPAGGAAA